LARDQGGDTAFTHEAKTSSFTARILQPIASAGSTTVARDDRPVGMYVLNVLPFVSIPERLSVAHLLVAWEQRPEDIPLHEAGTFVVHDGALWSFVPLAILSTVLAPIVDIEASQAPLRSSVENDPDQRRILSWLLRKHFERHLTRFNRHGLLIEEGRRKGRRAYFEGNDGKPRRYIYDTPHRKGVRRDVVKQRREPPRAWFENEGFGFEVTQVGDLWAVRIKPFYMFTGRDAKTPLPAFARTSRATRRIKLDRNKNVDDDLTFWARLLSEGSSTINIGQDHVEDLILEGGFLTIEVPEEGLLRDSDEGEDRMPA
jgi:hypothetical protein